MKRKILRILLWLSFVPALIIILLGVYHSIFGYDLYTMLLPTYVKTIYGIEAFMEIMILYGLSLTVIPVLPCCVGYQLLYLWIASKKYHKH